MSRFVIQPHVRLQEWVAEELGFFKDEGLDYEFQADGFSAKSLVTSSVQTTDEVPVIGERGFRGHVARARTQRWMKAWNLIEPQEGARSQFDMAVVV